MNTLTVLDSLASLAAPVWTILSPLLVPAVFYGLWAGIGELRKRGYRTAYAAAIVRALGAGYNAAQAAGIPPFSEIGRRAIAAGGAAYLMKTVGPEAAALGITTAAEHGERVLAQLGTEGVRAAADAAAAKPAQVVLPPLPADKAAELRAALEAAGQGVLDGLLPAVTSAKAG